jgi:transmembrane sensor
MLEDSNPDGSQPNPMQEEASMWLARLGRGLRPEEANGLREWLKNADHRRVILETARLWYGPDIIAVLGELFPAGPEPMKSDVTWWDIARVTLTTAVTVGLIFLVVTGRQPWSNMRLQWARMHGNTCNVPLRNLVGRGLYSTSVGEWRQFGLPDNTSVTLNTHTCLSVAYSPFAREVYLPYGEATFRVAHDSKRPFFVRAGSRRFQAMGTNFNVRVLSPEDVELTVTEGNVKVIYTPTSSPETPDQARLRANMTFDDTTVGALETALVEPGMQFVRKLEARDVDTLLAWQQGMIFFKGEPLSLAIAEVARYTNVQLLLADQKLGDIPIDGRFRTGDVEGLLRTLRQEFWIDSHRDVQGRIVLTALPHPHETGVSRWHRRAPRRDQT